MTRPADALFPEFAANKRAQRCAFDDGRGGPAATPHDTSRFADELSRREFAISGLCQACQRDVFGEEE